MIGRREVPEFPGERERERTVKSDAVNCSGAMRDFRISEGRDKPTAIGWKQIFGAAMWTCGGDTPRWLATGQT
nr:hypothetical protein Iba_chr02bCG12890 [Ipomoea batatas]GMC66775.1 hypothetical protein Iba_chr02eCG8860 [Ipomoea batatas]